MNLPLELLFNLLSLARRAPSVRALHRQLRARQLFYGPEVGTPAGDAIPFGFWLRLAQAAALLDETAQPTLFVPEWLDMPLEAQWHYLLEAWLAFPGSPRNRDTRTILLTHLLAREEISPTERRELKGLQFLNLVEEETLTPFGQSLLEGTLQDATLPQPWYLHGTFLWVPYPPNYALLWELETYVDPVDPGVYPLDPRALRLASQRALSLEVDIVQMLPKLLARGMALDSPDELPALAELAYALDDQPYLTIAPGYLLTFSDPEEFRQMRRVPRLQPFQEGTLSAHHLFLSPSHASPILNWLQAHGLCALPTQTEENHQDPLTQNEQAVLLALVLFAEGSQAMRVPPGIIAKLIRNLPLSVRAAATRKAWRALEQTFPRPSWVPEPEVPPMPAPEILLRLERAIHSQTPVDFLYRKGQTHSPEARHVTPLLIEQRGLRFYLIGYCHTRRANRMFRLDRMVLA